MFESLRIYVPGIKYFTKSGGKSQPFFGYESLYLKMYSSVSSDLYKKCIMN